jgi:hypothetical protein
VLLVDVSCHRLGAAVWTDCEVDVSYLVALPSCRIMYLESMTSEQYTGVEQV